MPDETQRDAPPAASASDLETAAAWLVKHIEGYNWAMPGSTAQRAPALAELLASVRGVERAQPEPATREGDNG